ncbi:MAG TPA: zinc-binding dehydrogenase, partial [Chloroflexota bacterium]|nr:zinc-binding dehydrogenase [Chloroflexota bacterium]
HQYHGTQSWKVNWPVTLGHEFCGEIAALGPEVTSWTVGDRVACETAAYVCGVCALCRAGRYNLCARRLGFGYGDDGAAAAYVVARAPLLHAIPDNVSWEEAALTEPCSVATNAVLEQSAPRPGDTVVVLGPGPVGLLCTALLAATHPSHLIVVGVARDAARLQLARGYGATRTVIAPDEDVAQIVRELGDGLGADLVIDAAGVSATLRTALEVVRPAGQITKVGWGREPLGFNLDPLVQKAATLRGSFSHTWTTWERVLRLLGDRTLDVRPLFRSYPLDRWQEAFDAMEGGEVAKAVLIP